MDARRGITRRRLLAGLGVIGAGAVAAACGQAAPPAAEKVATQAPQVVERVVTQAPQIVERVVTQAPQVVEKVVTQVVQVQPSKLKATKIVFWGHDNHPVANAVAGFKERQPDVTVDIQAIGDWLTKFRATLASGKDVPDLVWLEATDIQDLGSKGVLLDVTEMIKPIKDKFVNAKLNEAFIEQKQQYVGVPGDVALVGLWYRQDILEKAGIKELPKDLKFDDFLRLATDVNKQTGAAAFLLPKNGWPWPFQIILAQLGGSVTSPDATKVTIDDEKGIAAMAAVKRLWETKANLDTEWLKAPYYASLKSGKLATDYMPAWMRGFVRAETKTPDEGAGQWRVAPLPVMAGGVSRTAQIGGATLASTKFTQSPDAVKEYMKYAFASTDGTIATGSWGIIPGYLPYLESAIFQNQKDPVFGDFLFAKVWADVAKELSPNFIRAAVYGESGDIVTRNMMPILQGEIPVEAGMKKIGDETRQANTRYQN